MGIFSPVAPLTVRIKPGQSIGALADDIAEQWALLQSRGSYPVDLLSRYPELKGASALEEPVMIRVVHEATEEPLGGSDLELLLTEEPTTCFLLVAPHLGQPGSWAKAFQAMLEAAQSNSELCMEELLWIDEQERHRTTVAWNNTSQPLPELCLHQLFQHQAQQTPDAVALVCGSECLTYGALNRRAERAAVGLRARGVGPETPVGVCMQRCPEMIVSWLAVLKAGGAYFALDPDEPAKRLARLVDQVGAALVIHDRPLEDWDSIVSLVAFEDCVGEGPDLPSAVWCDQLAYIMTTSGSTGAPRAVGVTHRNAVRLLFGQNYFSMGSSVTVLALSPATFDVAPQEIWGPLLHGGRCVLFPDRVPTPSSLQALIQKHRIDALSLVSPLLHAVVDESVEALLGLRELLTGGSVLSPQHVKRAYAALPQVRIVNCYGPTEASTDVCVYPVPRDESGRSVPIGRPIANTQVFVLDAYLQPLPVGMVGQLYVGGPGVSRGYLGNPALTAQAFLPDRGGAGERLYRTGDLVCYHPDGLLEFLGRADQQVKVRSNRVELGEIESCLMSHPGVARCAVVAREQADGNALVAYVVARAGYQSTLPDLREFLRSRLPAFMLASHYVFLDSLPLKPNGKLDVHALPSPKQPSSQSWSPPRGPLEETICGIWSQLLGLERIDRVHNFFELGGDSLLASRVCARLQKALALDVPLRLIFECPTPAAMALGLGGAQDCSDRLPPLERREPDEPAAMSFVQQRLWLLNRLTPESCAYNTAIALRLRGPLDRLALESSLREIIVRHELLRTVYTISDEGPVPSITIPDSLRIQVESLATSEADAEGYCIEEALRPFDLQTDLPIRFRLLGLETDHHIFCMTLHHIATDWWSTAVLMDELRTLYQPARPWQPLTLPPMPIQYADVAVWQRQCLAGVRRNILVAHWKERLRGAPPGVELPLRRPRPPLQTEVGSRYELRLEAALAGKVRELAAERDATPFTVLLAALHVLLLHYTGEIDQVLGTSVSQRVPETEALIGCFVNTLVLRTKVDGCLSFLDLIDRVRETTLDAYAHRDLPFEVLVEELRPVRDLSRNPMFSILVVMQNSPPPHFELHELEISTIHPPVRTAFDLELHIWEEGHVFRLEALYNTALLETSYLESFVDHYPVVVRECLKEPTQAIATARLLSSEERQVIEDFSNGPSFPSCSLPIHRKFEEQVALTPDRIALVQGCGWNLSYAALNRRANAVARRLLEAGVRTECPVAVCIENGFELAIGLLAVIKAGGAFLSLDPEDPPERLAALLGQAEIRWAVTTPKFSHLLGKSVHSVMVADDVGTTDTANLSIEVAPENLAYVLFTSGSTGQPRAVCATHAATMNRFQWMWRRYPFLPDEVVCYKSPIGFVDSVWELFGGLLCGVRTLMLQRSEVRDSNRFLAQLEAHGVTRIVLVPTHLQALLYHLPGRVPQLRQWTSSGEPLWTQSAGQFQKLRPGDLLLNLYGSTEVGGDVSSHEHHDSGGTQLPVGRPIDNTQVQVLDDLLQPVPIGVVQQVYVGGIQVARCYLNAPSQTALQFRPAPHGRRLFATGDQGYFHPDGELQLCGRADGQLKIRGHRVYPTEVEAAIGSHPGVRNAAVFLSEGELVAIWEPVSGCPPVEAELRSYLQERLPAVMCPTILHCVDSLNTTSHGKRQRSIQSSPDHVVGPALDGNPEPLEGRLKLIWRKLLGRPSVASGDNFFELGGHSLSAMRLLIEIEKEFSVRLPQTSIFQYPTIAGLAGLLKEAGSPLKWQCLVPLRVTPEAPLFFVHGKGGGVFCFSELAQALGQHFVGIAFERPAPSVEKLAQRYLKEVRCYQPHGPYRLGGLSLGGTIAFEMAQQLLQAGERVSFLGLVDTYSPTLGLRGGRANAMWAMGRRHLQRAAFHTENVLRLDSWHGRIGYLQRKLRGLLVSTSPACQDFAECGLSEAVLNYSPQPYTQALTLFRARHQPGEIDPDPSLGWGQFALALDITEIPGLHGSVLLEEPNVQDVAKKMRQRLAPTLEEGVDR